MGGIEGWGKGKRPFFVHTVVIKSYLCLQMEDQRLPRGGTASFKFRSKFYPEDVGDLVMDMTRRIFYQQAKDDILSENIQCSPEASVLLASYAMQAEVCVCVYVCVNVISVQSTKLMIAELTTIDILFHLLLTLVWRLRRRRPPTWFPW